jgi:hypothetical protein
LKKLMLMAAASLALTACEYEEVKRETGYKGRARVNPWLAAERFTATMGKDTRSVISWTAPEWHEAVWMMPAASLSNESYTRRMEKWVRDGGHLILLVEHADAEINDWSKYSPTPELRPALLGMLKRSAIHLNESGASGADTKPKEIEFDSVAYKVEAESTASVAVRGDKPGVFATEEVGDGRITVLTDGRLFRNRWISDNDHAALLEALIYATEDDGTVGFMRGSGLSLWKMLLDHLWPVLVALGVWLPVWLWKNLTRFGPLESAVAPSELRGYEHHLEALGDFQWRQDRATSLLAPLREQVVELGQRTSVRAGRRDDDFFHFLAERAGIPRERVFRALAEAAPADPAILTRTTADLQQLLKVLHNPIPS